MKSTADIAKSTLYKNTQHNYTKLYLWQSTCLLKSMIRAKCYSSNLREKTFPFHRYWVRRKTRVTNLSSESFIRETLPNCRQKVGAKSNLQNGRHQSTSSGTPFHQKACPLLESGKKGVKSTYPSNSHSIPIFLRPHIFPFIQCPLFSIMDKDKEEKQEKENRMIFFHNFTVLSSFFLENDSRDEEEKFHLSALILYFLHF